MANLLCSEYMYCISPRGSHSYNTLLVYILQYYTHLIPPATLERPPTICDKNDERGVVVETRFFVCANDNVEGDSRGIHTQHVVTDDKQEESKEELDAFTSYLPFRPCRPYLPYHPFRLHLVGPSPLVPRRLRPRLYQEARQHRWRP